jgi:hypothetical protein
VSTSDGSASLVVAVAPSADDGTAETPGGTEAPGLGVGTAIVALAVLAAALCRRG